jgi:hypothetical protein
MLTKTVEGGEPELVLSEALDACAESLGCRLRGEKAPLFSEG